MENLLITAQNGKLPSSHYDIRPAGLTDFDYVAATWFEVFRSGSRSTSRVRPSILRAHVAQRIDAALQRSVILIAAPKDDARTVLGFLILEAQHEPPIIHLLYVKSAFRRLGIGRALLGDLDVPKCAWSTMTPAIRRFDERLRLGEHIPLWLDATLGRAPTDG